MGTRQRELYATRACRRLKNWGDRAVFLHGRLKLVGAAGSPILEPSQPSPPNWAARAGILILILVIGAGAIRAVRQDQVD